MTNLEVLMMDGCTRSEAEKHLKRGTVVFESEDFEKNFLKYIEEWGAEEEKEEIVRMIDEKKSAKDWGIVEHEQKVWYIMYVL